MRECGQCALCCKLVEVTVLNKKAGDWCEHCTMEGCRIWMERHRPFACSEYKCLWLSRLALPESLRPDRSGIIFEIIDEKTTIALVEPANPEAWRFGEAWNLICAMLSNGVDLVVAVGSTKNVLLSGERTQFEVFQAIGAFLKGKGVWQPRATQLI